jgi:GntR family transcriptional repressor for pyruvate dehydrogenase complex
MLETIERSKLRDVVASRLKAYIIDRSLMPGDRLPTETQLASQFGVSRLSLREATKSLEFLGIVKAKPGIGLTVGQIRLDRVTEYLGLHPAVRDVSPDVLIDTRVIVETGALAHVAKRMRNDPTIHERLDGINCELQQARTLQRWIELDISFHRELIQASGLFPLTAFGDVLAVFFQRFRTSVKKAEWTKGIASHKEIIDSLQAGRVTDADRLLRVHIESHRGRV